MDQVNSADPGAGKLGLALRSIDRDEKRETGIRNGLVVEKATGAAARAGILRGDVILALNGSAVSSVAQLCGLVEKSGRRVALLFQRGGEKSFVPLNLT